MHEARGLFAFKGFVKKHSSEQGLIMYVNILWNTNLTVLFPLLLSFERLTRYFYLIVPPINFIGTIGVSI